MKNKNSGIFGIFFLILFFSFSFIKLSAQDDLKFIDDLISKMTIEEKAGQMSLFAAGWSVTGPTLNEKYIQLIREGKAGNIFNARTVDFVRGLQKVAVEETRLKIPLLIGYDVIHGFRTIFPIPLAQACSWDLALIEESERIAAREATASGVNWTFSPMVDIARDPRWGRVSEGAGEDTWLGCRIAEARVRGLSGKDLKDPSTLMTCAKHFAAYGAPQSGRDYNPVDMSQVSLYEWYLPVYKAAIDAGAFSVMTSFNEIGGVPATANKWLLTDVLRNEWNFRGFVVTDWTAIQELIQHGVASDLKDAGRLAINAGVDMDMQDSAFFYNIPALVREGRIDMKNVDDAVRRILIAKMKLGLFDDPYLYCSNEREKNEIMTKENVALARKFASESCVLLKNDKNILPIRKDVKSIAVIGPPGDSKKDMNGSWYASGNIEDCVTLVEGLKNRSKEYKVDYVYGCGVNDTSRAGFDSALAVAKKSDFIILALGESGKMTGEASSRSSIELPGVQNELAELIISTGKPVAVVLFNGRPLAIENLDRKAPAILEAWFAGTQAGNGIADVLFGDYNPSGKLTMSFPRNEGQIPVYYNHKNTGRPFNPEKPDEKYVSRYIDVSNDPLYPFGYGLSYTTFEYSGISASVKGDAIIISVNIANTGSRDGSEVVQLYVRDKVATITRPVKELRGFEKVYLKKGENKNISFRITKDDLAFYHTDLKKYYEHGEFIFYISDNSVTINY